MYFHNPEYERRPQDRKRVADVTRGLVEGTDEGMICALHIVPPLLQLYPEVEVAHADEAFCARDIFPKKATWLFAGRTLYLVVAAEGDDTCATNPFSSRMRVIHSEHVAPLLHTYLQRTGM